MRGRAVLSLLLVAFLCAVGHSAFERAWPNAASAGLSIDRPWTSVGAGAGRADTSGWRIECSGGELFGLRALRGASIRVERLGRRAGLCLSASRLGDDGLSERTLALDAGFRSSDGTGLRLRAALCQLAAAGYAPSTALGVDIEAECRITGLLHGRARATNLLGGRTAGAPLPQVLELEVALRTRKTLVVAGARVEEGFEASCHVGAEMTVTSYLVFRAGSRTGREETLSVGLGLGRPRGVVPVVDLAWQWHPALGGSSFASFSWYP